MGQRLPLFGADARNFGQTDILGLRDQVQNLYKVPHGYSNNRLIPLWDCLTPL
jgi:hypothetical protein